MAYPNASYWNGNGKYQHFAEELDALIPISGSVEHPRKNRALEKFRKARNCYYDLFNNGLCNRAREFYHVFGIASSHYKVGTWDHSNRLYEVLEPIMDEIVLAAMKEQSVNLL